MWKLKAPPRTRLLLRSILKNKVPTSDNLARRGLYGPYWCCFCKNNSKSLDHLFLFCLVTIHLWTSTHTYSHLPVIWGGQTTKEAWAN